MNTSIRELKDHLSEFVRRARQGEEIIVTSHNRPVAKLVPVTQPEKASKQALLAELTQLRRELRGKVKGEPVSQTVIRLRKEARY